MNSRTLFDAVAIQWLLRRVALTPTLLLLFWSLSPLGGQASLRLMYKRNTTVEAYGIFSPELRYMDVGPAGHMLSYVNVVEHNDVEPGHPAIPIVVSAAYHGALMQGTSIKGSPVDSWGNPKIPRIEQLRLSPLTKPPDKDGWLVLPEGFGHSAEDYASLFGIPIINPGWHGENEFSIETSYLVFSDPQVITGNKGSARPINITCAECLNFRAEGDDFDLYKKRLQGFLGPPFPVLPSEDEKYTKSRVINITGGVNGTTVLLTASQQHVETQFTCAHGNCRAVKVRESLTDKRPQHLTTFDFWGSFVLDLIVSISTSVAIDQASPTELFLNDTYNLPVSAGQVAYHDIPPDRFATNAAVLINTAIDGFISASGFANILPSSNLSIYGPPSAPCNLTADLAAQRGLDVSKFPDLHPNQVTELFQRWPAPFVGAVAYPDGRDYDEVWQLDYFWVCVLALASILLIILGVVGIRASRRTNGPDVYDPVLGLAWRNPYFGEAGAGVASQGARARAVGNITVSLGDVRPGEEVGKVVFAPVGTGLGKLAKGRFYE
jgi:hypothetical protein